MTRGAWVMIVVAALVLTIFVAGFFKSEAGSPLARGMDSVPCKVAPCEPRTPCYAPERVDAAGKVTWSTVQPANTKSGLLALTSSPNYKRAADLSLKVEDCTKAEDALEERLKEIKG